MGFVVDRAEATEWISSQDIAKQVLFPYLTGKDLNSRSDLSASRWIIDFNDRTEHESAVFIKPFERVADRVKPERQKNNRKVYRDYWWQFAERRPAMRKAIAELDEVLVLTRVSKTVMVARVPNNQVFSDRLTVFASSSFDFQAVLSSSIHVIWAIVRGTTRTGDPSYAPTAVFETFPMPRMTARLAEIGRNLDSERRQVMVQRDLSLTGIYDLINDPDIAAIADADVARLRKIHVELDEAVMDAYGWNDIPLDHGFHTYRQMQRWTFGPAARVRVLDRLLDENHKRAAAQGDAPPSSTDEDETEEDE